ncbi:MAG: TylF/MycF/NovP-related O-methyltransferase [Candidatus Auribacterota bacterium]|jgi:hypothetical protein|nr:TylF/MycF/NovP-related O-methyltransferase [Candidatus Auribacterota bacterium]
MTTLLQRGFYLANSIFPEGGTCLEFGVYVGDSYIWQAERILKKFPKTSLIGFDSWEGLPDETEGVWRPDRHNKGCFASAKEKVLSRLNDLNIKESDTRFSFVDGFFSESLTDQLRKTLKNIIFINIDVDLYKSTIEVLDFVKPILRPGIIIYWDDWKSPKDTYDDSWGEHRAWGDWIARNPEVKTEIIEVNPVNQRTMIVTQANGINMTGAGLDLCKIRYTANRLTQEIEL